MPHRQISTDVIIRKYTNTPIDSHRIEKVVDSEPVRNGLPCPPSAGRLAIVPRPIAQQIFFFVFFFYSFIIFAVVDVILASFWHHSAPSSHGLINRVTQIDVYKFELNSFSSQTAYYFLFGGAINSDIAPRMDAKMRDFSHLLFALVKLVAMSTRTIKIVGHSLG